VKILKELMSAGLPFPEPESGELMTIGQGPKTKKKFAGVRRSLDSLTNEDERKLREIISVPSGEQGRKDNQMSHRR